MRPYGGDCAPYNGFGWPGLKKIGVKISEVLKLDVNFVCWKIPELQVVIKSYF